ncbi:MAG: serine/threonine-protein kinase [Gemmatimonadetes bacterium]|nr:serine/threonine-protein kinase [Gemmatimonadota bacterium]
MQDTPQYDPIFLSFQLALAGRYSIDRELGRGGIGIVYLAREVHLDRPVAIKLLPPDRAADGTLKERFLREARLAAKLSHPNIIPIHAVDEVGEFVFYVMVYVDGETLADRVRTRGPLSASDGIRVLREAAWALAHAHSHGLVHRDVKPDNILLEHRTGRALVADFGIAAAAGAIAADGVSGTPEFMSPEQALGKELDPRSDIYGLGATAFYLFSGRLPFEGRTATEVLAKHVTEAAPPLGSLGISVPRKVALIIDRCLAKEPEHRPANADALAEQLGVALEQRRELPVALRAFVKRNGRLDGGLSLLYPTALLGASIGFSNLFGVWAGWALFGAGMTLAPFSYFAHAARRFSLLGFAHDDLAPAFKSELEQSREELAVEQSREPSRLEKVLKSVAITTVPIAGLSLVALLAFQIIDSSLPRATYRLVERILVTTWIAIGPLATVSSIWYGMLATRRRDIDTEFWHKIWMGRIGKFAFAVARKLIGNRTVGSAITHRATELSLGMAAEQLFDTLPRETRSALGDLPAVLKRLQADAQTLRRHHDALQDALNDAGDASAAPEYADVRLTRDAIKGKLGDAVGALETIRLNLLRLHAGSGTVEGLTTHIGLAVEVSAEVDRLLAAKAEVERGLAFPRTIASTPA